MKTPALSVPAPLDTPNNLKGGVLVVLPAGYGPAAAPVERSFFSDSAVDRGKVLGRFISWFALWGIPLGTTRMSASDFERSFFCCEWPSEKIEGAAGPQLVPRYAARAQELARIIALRSPRLVIFLSCYLWQAINTPEGRQLLQDALGSPLEPGRRISTTRLAAYAQRWQKAHTLALPLPGTNTTDAFVRDVAGAVQRTFRASGLLPGNAADPLLEAARGCLVIDQAASIRKIRTELHVSQERARDLVRELTGNGRR